MNDPKILSNPLIVEYFDNCHIGAHDCAMLFASEIIKQYYPREEIYHNGKNHIWPMLERFSDMGLQTDDDVELQFVGYFFALFHDAAITIQESRTLLNKHVNINGNKFGRLFEMVHSCIQATDYLFDNLITFPRYIQYCINEDIAGLYETDREAITKNEDLIFREYASVEYNTFKANRLRILDRIYDICNISDECKKIRFEIIEARKPRIAVYAGSFNPFHIGHKSILDQAEKNFDKVIVAVGINRSKTNTPRIGPKLSDSLPYNQIVFYDKSLPNLINSFDYPVTVIRGLRNGDDLQYEQNLRQTLRDFDKDINIAYFLCNPEHGHISSSMIREIATIAPIEKYLI